MSLKSKIKRKAEDILVDEAEKLVRNALGGDIPALGIGAGAIVSAMIDAADDPTPKSVSGATDIYVAQIRKDYPNFSLSDAEIALQTFINEYIDIVYAGKEEFTMSSVYDQVRTNVRPCGTVYDVSNVVFNKTAISGYHKSKEYATVQFQMSVGFDLNNNRKETRFIIEYSYRLLDAMALSEVLCPNCGAVIRDLSHGRCEYCEAVVVSDTIMGFKVASVTER